MHALNLMLTVWVECLETAHECLTSARRFLFMLISYSFCPQNIQDFHYELQTYFICYVCYLLLRSNGFIFKYFFQIFYEEVLSCLVWNNSEPKLFLSHQLKEIQIIYMFHSTFIRKSRYPLLEIGMGPFNNYLIKFLPTPFLQLHNPCLTLPSYVKGPSIILGQTPTSRIT